MGKSTRAPVLAAGGIVIRSGPKPLVAIVQRRRDNAWVLPKGKLKPNEKPIAAARREATEETGCDVRVHEFLGVISNLGGNAPKITHFWRMQVIDDSAGKLMRDIKAVEWLPLRAAIDRLSLPHEQSFLRNVGPHALRGAVEKARAKPLRATAQPPAAGAPAIIDPDAAATPRVRSPRWNIFARFGKRLQEVLGRTS
ncbi:MAG TPA: NUDIX domain-containing protein [Xanthobacteraceae bacterium]|jgi:8-oxo-dGTP diphosphatase